MWEGVFSMKSMSMSVLGPWVERWIVEGEAVMEDVLSWFFFTPKRWKERTLENCYS